MADPNDECNCDQALALKERVVELEASIERYLSLETENAVLHTRIETLEQALAEQHVNPELAESWARRGAEAECVACAACGCMRCKELVRT